MARKWKKLTIKCAETLQRAASLQAQRYGVHSPIDEAQCLASTYAIWQKRMDWHDYGDIAFHLIAKWPPDLAYSILYSFREIEPKLTHDPAPLILKAMEEIYYLQPDKLKLRLEITKQIQKLTEDSVERAKMGAKLIAREISVVPLRWASGVYHQLAPTAKPYVEEQLRNFNPQGAEILSKGPHAWLLTFTGLLRILVRVLFGKDNV